MPIFTVQRLKTTLISVLLILLGGLFYWGTSRLSLKPPPAIENHQIDEYMMNIKAKQYDGHGRLSQHLQIDALYHQYGESFMRLSLPRFKMYQPQGIPWTIEAKMGKAHQTSEHPFDSIELEQNVSLEMGAPNQGIWYLKGEHLHIFPHQEHARTPEQIQLVSEGMHITAQGMLCDFTLGKIQLLNQVRSYYEPFAL